MTLEGSSAAYQGRHAYVVDDDDAFRNSVEALLTSADWEVRTFASGREFLSRCPSLDPGLLLLDLNLQGESGLDLLESQGAELERFAVVVVTGTGEVETAVRSMKAGAFDFLEKPFVAESMLEKLEHVHVAHFLSLKATADRSDAKRRIAALSNREQDVLAHLLNGFSNKVIARALGLSHRTVEMHRARMLQKLQVKATAQAVQLARLAGLKSADG